MEKEYIGVSGYKAIVDESNNTFFIKSNICKENCYLPHIEWIDLGQVNFQGRGTMTIFTDAQSPLHIVYKRNQYDKIKELYNTLHLYTKEYYLIKRKENLLFIIKEMTIQ